MTYGDEYDEREDEYDEDAEYTGQDDRDYGRRRARPYAPDRGRLVEQAVDWGTSGSILAILILTAIYVFSPVDLVPDLIPVAGQADDIAAILAGGGSVTFLTIMRYALRTRVGRWGCLIFIALSAIGAFAIFWVLMRLFDSLV